MARTLCGRTSGIGLNEIGRKQAETTAGALAGRTLSAIYSSPLERALETAQIIAAPHGMTPLIEDRFTELDFGQWTGKTFEELELEPRWREYNRARSSVTPPGGESPLQALSRSHAAIFEHAAQFSGGEFAVVTHADVIRSLLTSLLSMKLDDLLRFDIAPASVSELTIGGAYPIIHSLSTLYAVER